MKLIIVGIRLSVNRGLLTELMSIVFNVLLPLCLECEELKPIPVWTIT